MATFKEHKEVGVKTGFHYPGKTTKKRGYRIEAFSSWIYFM